MATQILRPTSVKGGKNQSNWKLSGTWGERVLDPMSQVDFYRLLHGELVAGGVLPPNSPVPSNRYHGEVTMTLMDCSWVDGRWILDELSLRGHDLL